MMQLYPIPNTLKDCSYFSGYSVTFGATSVCVCVCVMSSRGCFALKKKGLTIMCGPTPTQYQTPALDVVHNFLGVMSSSDWLVLVMSSGEWNLLKRNGTCDAWDMSASIVCVCVSVMRRVSEVTRYRTSLTPCEAVGDLWGIPLRWWAVWGKTVHVCCFIHASSLVRH